MLNIATRIFKQVLRDKRTLMLLLVAPLLILTLIYFLFNYSDESKELKIGTYQANEHLINQLHDKNIKTVQYDDRKNLKDKFKFDNLDGFIEESNQEYSITYENSDPSVTNQLKLKVNQILVSKNINQLTDALNNQSKMLSEITKKLPDNIKQNLPQQDKPKIEKIETTNHYLHGNKDTNYFDTISPVLIAFFVFFFTFLISGISLLKERTSGTLDRTLSSPIKKYQIIIGYIIGYGTFAIIQTALIVVYSIYVLQMTTEGNIALVFITNILISFIALTLGLLLSTFASSEFQMIQFIPLAIVPQVFFAGIIPVDSMHKTLQYIAHIMPLYYAGDAIQNVMIRGYEISDIYINWIILFLIFVLLLILNILGMKRYRKV